MARTTTDPAPTRSHSVPAAIVLDDRATQGQRREFTLGKRKIDGHCKEHTRIRMRGARRGGQQQRARCLQRLSVALIGVAIVFIASSVFVIRSK